MVYILVDESLNKAICRKVFGWAKSEFAFNRSKKFKAINHYMLEGLALVKKIDFVKSTFPIPAGVTKKLYALNDLRNALAHSWLPQQRRVKPLWNGNNIYSSDGYSEFVPIWDPLRGF